MNTNDYFHMNAVRILKDGNYLASARHTQTIMKIDKTSGKILWHMGKGKLNNFKFVNDPYDGFSHQHAPEELENGNILIWDNGIDSIKDGSRVVEYKIDEISYTATLVWSKEFKNLQANVAGNCHKISENSYIAAFGSQGYIEEFNNLNYEILECLPVEKRSALLKAYFDTGMLMLRPEVRERALELMNEIISAEEAKKQMEEEQALEKDDTTESTQADMVAKAVELGGKIIEPKEETEETTTTDDNEEVTELKW